MTGFFALFFCWVSFTQPAAADEAGAAWLQRIDQASEISDVHMRLELAVTDAQGQSAQRVIEIWQKGSEKRLVRMVSPARLKGIGLLVGAKDSLHLYLPSYPPSRRVVGSKRGNAFMGTDFAIEDLSRLQYANRFDAVEAGTEESQVKLVLTPLEDHADAQIHLWVANEGDAVVHRVDHLDESGTVTRRLTMTDFRRVSGYLLPHALQVDDLIRNRSTKASVTAIKIGAGLQDRIFTVPHLEHP